MYQGSLQGGEQILRESPRSYPVEEEIPRHLMALDASLHMKNAWGL